MVTEAEIKQIAGDVADQAVSNLKPKKMDLPGDKKPDSPDGKVLDEDGQAVVCKCETLKPMKEWLAESAQQGEQCKECIMRPIGEYYIGALDEAKAEKQIKDLSEAWETQDLLTIGESMDRIKNEVGEHLRKRLTTFDCLAQTYKPEVVVDEK